MFRLCAYIMHTAQEQFIAYVFHCEPSAGALSKTIEAACKVIQFYSRAFHIKTCFINVLLGICGYICRCYYPIMWLRLTVHV